MAAPPPKDTAVFLHGEFLPVNMLWLRGRITGLTDWNGVHRGARAIDVGHCRRYLAALYSPESSEQLRWLHQSIAGVTLDPWWDLYALLHHDDSQAKWIRGQVAGRRPADVPGRLASVTAALLTGVVALTGCSSQVSRTAGASEPVDGRAGSASEASTVATGTASSMPVAQPSTSQATAPATSGKVSAAGCLFTLAQVSSVLGGTWERQPQAAQSCAYLSDRGARFATVNVQAASERGLQAARSSCVAGAEPMTAAGQGFVCLEQRPSGDLVMGNTVARGRLWIVVIKPVSGGTYDPEFAAMLALMNAVPVGN